LEYRPGPEDFISLNMRRERTFPVTRRRARVSKIGETLIVGWVGFAIVAALTQSVAAGVAAGILAAGALWLLWPRVWRRVVRSEAEGLVEQHAANVHHLSIDDDGLFDRSSEGELRLPWSAIESLDADQGRLFVFVSPAIALVVPKRDSREEVEALEREIRRRTAAETVGQKSGSR
jgi:hypothetical protein